LRFWLSEHAEYEIRKRSIPEDAIESVLENPSFRFPSREGRVVFQGKYFDAMLSKEMVLRIICVEEAEGFKVITAYKTSKFEKYWPEGET
jgi:hypothetical protein